MLVGPDTDRRPMYSVADRLEMLVAHRPSTAIGVPNELPTVRSPASPISEWRDPTGAQCSNSPTLNRGTTPAHGSRE
jgi:hypothetical protein